MGMADKARKAQRARMAQSQQGTQSSTLAVVNPTAKRVRAVITNLSDFVTTAGDAQQKRMGRVMSIIIDEVIDELGERDEAQLQRWMLFMGRILEWSGTGNIGILPQELVPFIADVEGISVEEAQRQWEDATRPYSGEPVFEPDITTELATVDNSLEIVDAEIVD